MDETQAPDLSVIVVTLLKGVLYRDESPAVWQSLLSLQARVRDYVSVLGLELELAEEDGFAYLSGSREESEEREIPRLVARRPLSYTVSLTLALLRRKLAEHDARSGDDRLVLDREEIVETVQLFLPAEPNEARLIDRIDRAIRQIGQLGFVRFLDGSRSKVEVKRILAAFVDAQWLNEFDRRLKMYAEHGGQEYDDQEHEAP